MRGLVHPRAYDPGFPLLFPSERHRGQKKRHLRWIMRHVPAWACSLGDGCSGTGVVSWLAKARGLRVHSNEIMMFGHLRGRVLVANGRVRLDERDVAALEEPNPRRLAVAREWYGAAVGTANAAWLDNLAANLPRLSNPVKRDVAAYAAVSCLMRRMNYPQVTFTHDRRFTGKRHLQGFDWGREFREEALRRFPPLLHDNGMENEACRGDVLDFVRTRLFDCLYLDLPFAGTSAYERDLAFYDKLCLVLEGRHELVGCPFNGSVPLPPHACFSRRESALTGICRLFRLAAGIPRILLSYNTTSDVLADEIARDGERICGSLVAREEMPAPVRSRRAGRPPACKDVLLVFDGRAASSVDHQSSHPIVTARRAPSRSAVPVQHWNGKQG